MKLPEKKKKARKNFIAWLIVLLTTSVALNIFQFGKSRLNPAGILVLGVIDGDTLVLDGKVRVRLRSVDAPELEFCGGEEARQELERLVSGQRVRISEEVIDQKGRPMSLVYVGNILVNEMMLAAGWSRFHSDNSSARDILKSSYENARQQKLGIWSSRCQQTENPDNPKCNIKGNFDDNSDRRNYYFPGCPQYNFTVVEKDRGEQWFCSDEEAQKAGFTRPKNC